MALFSSKSDWLDKLDKVKKLLEQDAHLSHAALTSQLGVSKAETSNLTTLNELLDQAAIDKIRSATIPSANMALGQSNPIAQLGASQQMPLLSLNSALALAGLKKAKPENLSALVHTALDVTLAQHLTTQQIKNLVKWIISGNPASEFDPHAKVQSNRSLAHSNREPQLEASAQRTPDPALEQQLNPSLDLKKLRQLLEKTEEERIQGKETVNQGKLVAYILKAAETLGPQSSKKSSGSDEVLSETVLLDWLADINVVKQLQSKRKKGKSLSGSEWGLLALHKLGEGLGHLAKLILKLFKPFLKILHRIWKLVIEALKTLGLYQYAKAIFTLLVFIAVIWFGWEAFRYGVARPVEMLWSRIHFSHAAENTVEQEPVTTEEQVRSSELEVSSLKPKTFNSKLRTTHSAPVVAYQPAVSFVPAAYDPKLLEQEIAAIPANSVIRDYVFQPDEGMPADLAFSRFQDLTDEDKYTMMIGSSKVKILSVIPSGTNFTINYKSTDLFGILGSSSGTMNIFLEDIKYIHINEIDHFSKPGAQPDINANGNSGTLAQSNPAPQLAASTQMYQCTVVAKGAKFPLTIQCASTDDLENLVSTLEYFIRHSRLARDAQPAGLPYPTQGLRLTSDCVVEKLWANSPADKAGLQPGDMIWSVDKNAADPPNRKKLEAQLAALTAGSHSLFVSSHADWEKAQSDVSFNRASSLNPKRRKVSLQL